MITASARMACLAAGLLLAAGSAPAQVNQPLGALQRTNEAVGAAGAAQAAAAPADNVAGGGLVAPAAAPSGAPSPGTPGDSDIDDTDLGPEDTRGMSYDPEGRRDPFRALTGEAAGTEQRKKFEGTLKGRLLSEVKLTSILRHPDGNIATFEGGPKKEGYFAKVGDELWDGTIVKIDFETMTVVVRQTVEDPRLIKQWRDIPIPLWTEEEKQGEGTSTP